MVFKQYIQEYCIKYINNKAISYYSIDKGSRKEYSKIEVVKNEVVYKESNLINPLAFLEDHIKELEMLLNYYSKDICKYNASIVCYIKDHLETVTINENLDKRYYNLLRLVIKVNSNINIIFEEPININEISFIKIKAMIDDFFKENHHKVVSIYNKQNLLKIDSVFKEVELAPISSGYFCHEIIGHLLENDIFNIKREQISKMEFPKQMTVVDDIEGHQHKIGLNKLDDIGREIKPLTLIDSGKINEIISIDSKDNLRKSDLYGFARSQNYQHTPLSRMRMTILKGNKLITPLKGEYIHVSSITNGEFIPSKFTYKLIGEGYIKYNQNSIFYIPNLEIEGNIVDILNNISEIGDDLTISSRFCVKKNQVVRVGIGAPTIHITNVKVKGVGYEL